MNSAKKRGSTENHRKNAAQATSNYKDIIKNVCHVNIMQGAIIMGA